MTLTRNFHATISTWRVDTRFNESDHNTVLYDIQFGFESVPSTRPWDRARWGIFTGALLSTDIFIPSSMTTKKLDRLISKLNTAIEDALKLSCPKTPAHHRDPHNRVERLYQLQRRSPTPHNVARFVSIKLRYWRVSLAPSTVVAPPHGMDSGTP